MTEGKALQPLANGGIVLIVGAKASNFDDELKTHPRVTIWDSQNENWEGREMPSNTRAVFMTRFISHNTSSRILAEARKRQITIFNPDGTGIIAKQVRELLAIAPKSDEPVKKMQSDRGKLRPLIPFIDFTLTNTENGKHLLNKAQELGITTTLHSMIQFASRQRREQHRSAVPKSIRGKLDVSVEILDNMVKELQDMRDFLMATVDENRTLRAKVDRFKKVFDE